MGRNVSGVFWSLFGGNYVVRINNCNISFKESVGMDSKVPGKKGGNFVRSYQQGAAPAFFASSKSAIVSLGMAEYVGRKEFPDISGSGEFAAARRRVSQSCDRARCDSASRAWRMFPSRATIGTREPPAGYVTYKVTLWIGVFRDGYPVIGCACSVLRSGGGKGWRG